RRPRLILRRLGGVLLARVLPLVEVRLLRIALIALLAADVLLTRVVAGPLLVAARLLLVIAELVAHVEFLCLVRTPTFVSRTAACLALRAHAAIPAKLLTNPSSACREPRREAPDTHSH